MQRRLFVTQRIWVCNEFFVLQRRRRGAEFSRWIGVKMRESRFGLNPKIMLVGLGDLGTVLLETLLRLPEQLEIVVTARNVQRAARRCNLARLEALAQGIECKIRLIQIDLNNIDATAECIHREQPAILLTTATMATWWLPDLLPPGDAQGLRRAGFGVWLPVHLAPTLKAMQAVRQANYSGFVLTAPYPDAVNCILGKIGLAPTCGIGNIAEMVPKVKLCAARALGVSIDRIRIEFVAHHALIKHVLGRHPPTLAMSIPPFLLRIECDGKNVTDGVNLRDVVLAAESLPSGRETHWLTAASAVPLIRTLLQGTSVFLHAPGPGGLPGGYPIRASSSGVELALGDIPLDAARRVNEQSQPFDGISEILEDGTAVLVDENVARMKKILEECPGRIEITTVDEQANDLVDRFTRYARSRGVQLP